jgi:hypothetical protein
VLNVRENILGARCEKPFKVYEVKRATASVTADISDSVDP